jgi:hypothetical protein
MENRKEAAKCYQEMNEKCECSPLNQAIRTKKA